MAKTLKTILETYAPRSVDEKKFIDKHVIVKHPDRNGNGDEVFKASNIKAVKRASEHGYDAGKDAAVYEEAPVAPEDTFLEEETVGYKHYRITAGQKTSNNEIGSPEHITGHPGKMKALGVHTKQGDSYGHASHVTVTNTVTGEQSHHNVYQREWGKDEGRPLVSIRHLKKVHPGHTNVLKHYLAGKTKLAEEMSPQETYHRKHGFYSYKLKAPSVDDAIGHAMNTITNAYGKGKKASVKEETVDEAYPSAAAMSRKAKVVKQARAVANGYANQKSGKWKSESYKTDDGRWASRDVKEDVEQIDEALSNAYAFTHTPGDADSEEKLTKLKKMVKAHNSTADEQSKLRIVARGRMGTDNPNAEKYQKGGEIWNKKSRPAGTYDANHNWKPKGDGSRRRGDMRDISMKDAKHHAIYVHPAPRGWDKPGFQERYAKDPYNKITTNHAKSLISAHKAICEETLVELSKGTLGSYIKKASSDVASKAVEYGTKKAERDEVDRITNRHMKYADKDTIHKALKTTSDDVEGPRVKAAKRIGGITKAVNKLTNEEVLAELSKKTLGSYVTKAMKSKDDLARKVDDFDSSEPEDHDDYGLAADTAEKQYNKAASRQKMIHKAVGKLTNEDVQLDELAESLKSRFWDLAGKAVGEDHYEAIQNGAKNFHDKAMKEIVNAKFPHGHPKRDAAVKLVRAMHAHIADSKSLTDMEHRAKPENLNKAMAQHTQALKEDVQLDEASASSAWVMKSSDAAKKFAAGMEKAHGIKPVRIAGNYVHYEPNMDPDHVKTGQQLRKELYKKTVNEDVQLDEAPYYSLEASKARMAKEKARAAAKAAIAAAKADSSIARKEARENRSLHIARHIEAEVGNHYPDSDGFEAISNKVRKMGIPHHEVIDHLDKAARKHLGAKSFDHYVDNFHKDAQGSN